MSKFFQSELAAYAGEKQTFQNVKFKKGQLNNSYAAEKGTILEIIPVHIKNPPVIQFVAYIASLSDSHSANYASQRPFGRTNPYYVWSGNSRTISVSWDIPSSSKTSALNNLNNLSWLVSSIYPTFKETDTATSVSASPLFRFRHANLISSPSSDGQGILCVIPGISVTHEVSAGIIAVTPEGMGSASSNLDGQLINNAGFANSVNEGKTLLIPKLFKLAVTLDVVHDHALGWDHHTGEWRGGIGARNYPYNLGLIRDSGVTPAVGVEVFQDVLTPGQSSEPVDGSVEQRVYQNEASDLNGDDPGLSGRGEFVRTGNGG